MNTQNYVPIVATAAVLAGFAFSVCSADEQATGVAVRNSSYVQNGAVIRENEPHPDLATATSFPSIRAEAPYTPSPVIAGITWAPKESIIRLAKGSDNFSLTWADDGHLYVA